MSINGLTFICSYIFFLNFLQVAQRLLNSYILIQFLPIRRVKRFVQFVAKLEKMNCGSAVEGAAKGFTKSAAV